MLDAFANFLRRLHPSKTAEVSPDPEATPSLAGPVQGHDSSILLSDRAISPPLHPRIASLSTNNSEPSVETSNLDNMTVETVQASQLPVMSHFGSSSDLQMPSSEATAVPSSTSDSHCSPEAVTLSDQDVSQLSCLPAPKSSVVDFSSIPAPSLTIPDMTSLALPTPDTTCNASPAITRLPKAASAKSQRIHSTRSKVAPKKQASKFWEYVVIPNSPEVTSSLPESPERSGPRRSKRKQNEIAEATSYVIILLREQSQSC